MSYLDRIAECNRHDLGRYVPFEAAGHHVGWIRRDRTATLARVADCLDVEEDGVRLAPELGDFAARSAAVAALVERLRAEGQVTAWRGESYPVGTSFGAAPLLQMERAAVPYFGVRAYGIHLNGFVRRGPDLHVWVAHRARDKETYPGMLDNLVAGGQPIDLSLEENVRKECAEEAGIPAELSARAVAVGEVTYCHESETGLKPDCMFCYDLELPTDFRPRCADGEVESFELWPVERVAEVVRESSRFKFNCNLVILDFLLRHGVIPPDHPDRDALAAGLRRKPPLPADSA